MAFQRVYNQIAKPSGLGRDTQGVALFMVLASISVLAILVTDFVYIAQVSQAIAFGGLDQAQAHYLAKSGLRLSLLRLKAFQQAGKLVPSSGAGAMVPKSLLNKIWNYPFFYPIPTNIPGLSTMDKDLITKFQKEVGIEGKFSAIIDSESSKTNLNAIVPNFGPSPTPTPIPQPTTSATSTPIPTPDAAQTRNSLQDQLQLMINQKTETDIDFAANYRDFRVPDFVDVVAAWADRTYQRVTPQSQDPILMKRAPFYTVGELHNLYGMDDELYNLFAPSFTTSMTKGININTVQEVTLRSLIPLMTKEETKEFFKYRDSEASDNQFKDENDFFTYLQKAVAAYKNQSAIEDLKVSLAKQGVKLIIDETQFKITVQATVNSATRTIEAWVTLGTPAASPPIGLPGQPPIPPGQPNAPQQPATSLPTADSGLTITYMRIY